MKKKRKYVILSYMLIYSKLMLYFFSFYNFLFFRLLAVGINSHFLRRILVNISFVAIDMHIFSTHRPTP